MSALAYFADSSRTFPEVREVPIVLQKSPWRSSRIKIRNDRIGANRFLNQPCALIPILNQSCALGCAKSFCNTICQTWTSATLHSITSSARASRGRRHIEAERPGGLEVDDQPEPRRLYDGQICGLRAVENPAGVGANLPICVDEAVLDRLIAAGGDDWNRRGRWREALKDGLVREPPFKGTRAE